MLLSFIFTILDETGILRTSFSARISTRGGSSRQWQQLFICWKVLLQHVSAYVQAAIFRQL